MANCATDVCLISLHHTVQGLGKGLIVSRAAQAMQDEPSRFVRDLELLGELLEGRAPMRIMHGGHLC